MAALSQDRNTPERDNKQFSFPAKANTKIYAGSIVVLNGGVAQPGVTAAGLKTVGRAESQVDNTGGGAGDLNVPVRRGTFRWDNSAAGDQITLSDVGAPAYVVDDHTVAKTDGGATRSSAGTIRDVDAQGVWVQTGA